LTKKNPQEFSAGFVYDVIRCEISDIRHETLGQG